MLRATLRTRVRLALLPIHTRTRLQWFQGDVHTSALIMPRNYVAPTGTRVTLSKISIELTWACFRCFLVHKESSEIYLPLGIVIIDHGRRLPELVSIRPQGSSPALRHHTQTPRLTTCILKSPRSVAHLASYSNLAFPVLRQHGLSASDSIARVLKTHFITRMTTSGIPGVNCYGIWNMLEKHIVRPTGD
jgi:hypothetical protein